LIYNLLYRKIYGDPHTVKPNCVFVGGFGTFNPKELFGIDYWGIFGDNLTWTPKIGPFSSMEDRASELIAEIFNLPTIVYPHTNLSKPRVQVDNKLDLSKNLTLIGHSGGGNTINAMLIMLEKEMFGDLKDKLLIGKIIYLASPQKGVEYLCDAVKVKSDDTMIKYGLGWWFLSGIYYYNKYCKYLTSNVFDLYIDQYQTFESWVNTNNNIFTGFMPHNAIKSYEQASQIILNKQIKTEKIITYSSGFYGLLHPWKSLPLQVFVFNGCGWKPKQYKNDGVVSVYSQACSHKCVAPNNNLISRAECKCLHLNVDHLQIVGTFDVPKEVKLLYNTLLDN